jgi:hypothetical protein
LLRKRFIDVGNAFALARKGQGHRQSLARNDELLAYTTTEYVSKLTTKTPQSRQNLFRFETILHVKLS